jgi:hypothetical protein
MQTPRQAGTHTNLTMARRPKKAKSEKLKAKTKASSKQKSPRSKPKKKLPAKKAVKQDKVQKEPKMPERIDLSVRVYGDGKKPVRRDYWEEAAGAIVSEKMAKIEQPGDKRKTKREKKQKKRKKARQTRETRRPKTKEKTTQKKFRDVDPETIEQEKRLIMVAGVSFFMILIFSIWVMNVKNIFKQTALKNNTEDNIELNELTSQLEVTLKQVREGIGEIKQEFGELAATGTEETADIGLPQAEGTANQSSSTINSSEINDEEIEALKKKLEELTND